MLAFAKEPYLHMLRMPLAQAVTLDEAVLGSNGQSDGETSARDTVECESCKHSTEAAAASDTQRSDHRR